MQIPAEFLAKLQDSNNKWFTMSQPTNSNEVSVVSETKILQDQQDSDTFQVGIKQDKYTMIYKLVTSITYEPSSGGDVSDYFNIICADTSRYRLFCANGVDHNISNELVTNKTEKMVHLIKGIPGEKGADGKNGLSSYELWSKRYPGISQDEFIKNLNNAYSYGQQVEWAMNKVKELAEAMEVMKTNHQAELDSIKEQLGAEGATRPDVLPISTLIYCHNNPDPSRWLPFGFNSKVYLNSDYPELAKIVRSWGAAFIVDDNRFKLGDASDKNRYIFCAGGSRPAGFIMSSQLPNATGYVYFGTDNNGSNSVHPINPTGAFYGTGRPGAYISDHNPRGDEAGYHDLRMDLSRVSNIYKNSATQVYGDSLSMNCYIKALM